MTDIAAILELALLAGALAYVYAEIVRAEWQRRGVFRSEEEERTNAL